ncbi:MAG: butyrate kinase [Verrucomicrobia bacterium]|nr:butyrate kinase [Verrucomicrobiota bacterium]
MFQRQCMQVVEPDAPIAETSVLDLSSRGPGFVLAINPGSLSIKLGVGQRVDGAVRFVEQELSHSDEGKSRRGQIRRRLGLVLEFLRGAGAELSKLQGVCARGGFLEPTDGGLIRVNLRREGRWAADERVLGDMEKTVLVHPSNYAIPIALGLLERCGIDAPAFTLDPVTTDQMAPVAQYSGKAGFRRRSIFHALNVFAASRLVAERLGRTLDELCLVVCHLGGGTSVVALEHGRSIDVNNAFLGEPPFTPQRGVPQLGDAIDYALQLRERGMSRADIVFGEFTKNAGLRSYTGTADLREIEARIGRGDRAAAEAVEAMAYQIVKALGAMAAVLGRRADGVVFTGGGARSGVLLDAIARAISRGVLDGMAAYVVPGTLEQYAMVERTLRCLDGEIEASPYRPRVRIETPRPIDRLADLLEQGKALIRENPKTVALCLPNDESLWALRDAHDDGIVRGAVLVGERGEIEAVARAMDLDLDAYSMRVVEPTSQTGVFDEAVAATTATRLVRDGVANMLMKGLVSTSALLKAVLDKEHGLARAARLSMSVVTYLPRHDRLIVFADPGINTETDDFDLMVEEVHGALRLAGYLDMTPRVAFLSAIERATPRIPSTVLARHLAEYFTDAASTDATLADAAFQGPLSLDLALDPEVAADKACGGPVVGQANVLIFPNIESANAFYKFVTQIEPSRLIATAIPGTTAPCVISSRGDSEADRMASLVFGAYLEELYQRRLTAAGQGARGA